MSTIKTGLSSSNLLINLCVCLFRKFNSGNNCTPFFAVYGVEAYNGLEIVSQLTKEQKGRIKTSKQLFQLLGN